jgi:hypothetical protein
MGVNKERVVSQKYTRTPSPIYFATNPSKRRTSLRHTSDRPRWFPASPPGSSTAFFVKKSPGGIGRSEAHFATTRIQITKCAPLCPPNGSRLRPQDRLRVLFAEYQCPVGGIQRGPHLAPWLCSAVRRPSCLPSALARARPASSDHQLVEAGRLSRSFAPGSAERHGTTAPSLGIPVLAKQRYSKLCAVRPVLELISLD